MLDVAGGAGNTALAAARRWADVICADYVPDLLERAQRRAEAEELPIRIQVADAQQLPFDDGAFDVVTSTFGAMFAPDQSRTAAELLRDRVSALETRPQHTEICHHDTAALFELFREWFGPVATTWHTLEEPHRSKFRDDWISLAEKFNIARDGTCEIVSEYLEIVSEYLEIVAVKA